MSENGSNVNGGIAQSVAPEQQSSKVADLLSQRREQLGYDLQIISQKLCIRKVYLRALESGDFDEIPDGPYRIGYLKAYARELHLDPSEIAALYREEVDGKPEGPELEFPVAVTEDRRPSFIIVVIGVLLAGAAYLVWNFFLSDKAEPKEMVELYEYVAPENLPVDAVKKAPEAVVEPETVPATDIVVTDDVSKPLPEETSDPMLSEQPKTSEEVAVETVVEEAQELIEETEEIVSDVLTDPSETSISEPSVEALPLSEDTPNVEETVEEEETPTVVSEMDTAPVILMAKQESWIEIRHAQTGERIFSGILQADQNYEVATPYHSVLKVGNAGGLDIMVNGSLLKPLGGQGQVRSNIALDPTLLLQKYGQ